jgi:hypothetical protein
VRAAAPAPQALPATQQVRQAPSRGRHSSGEDPLTSSAYSLRSAGSVDGRSYQASRRARELTRDQYEAAISQETQTFSVADAEAAPGGYPGGTPPFRPDLPPGPASNGPAGTGATPGAHRSARPDAGNGYASNGNGYASSGYGSAGAYPSPYGQPSHAAPLTQTPPNGEGYGYDDSRNATDGEADDPRWGSGARDYGRPAVKGGRGDAGRGERPAYQAGYPRPYEPRGTDRR